MSGLAGPSALVAHGGAGGLIVEIGLLVGILAVFATMFLRERRATRREETDEPDDEVEKLFREGHDEDA